MYDDLTKARGAPLPSGYRVVGIPRTFLSIQTEHRTEAEHYAGDGWKLHLSVHPADVPRAFDLLIPIVERHGGRAFKVTMPAASVRFHDPRNAQRGKQFTVYGARNPKFAWDRFVRDIEIAFGRAGIRPSHPVVDCRAVPGSRYASYRNDLSHGRLNKYATAKGYLSSSSVRQAIANGDAPRGSQHNPTRRPDPLKDVDFTNDPEIAAAREAGRGRTG